MSEQNQNWWTKLQNLNTVALYAILVVLMLVPLLHPLALPVKITPHSIDLYEKIESLKPGDVVLLDFSWMYAFKMLHHAAHVAVLKHLFSRPGVKIVMVCFFDASSELSWRDVINEVNPQVNFPEKQYGKDWIWLGYITGMEAAVLAFADNPWQTVPTDKYKTPISNYPDFYDAVKSAPDFALVIEGGGHGGVNGYVTGGFLKGFGLKYGCWLAYNMDPSCIAEFYPYYPTVIKSLLNGNAGAAEYERLMNQIGAGTKYMDAISSTHVYAIILIVIANIGFFGERLYAAKASAQKKEVKK